MRRSLVLLAPVLAVGLSLASCSSDGPSSGPSTGASTGADASAPTGSGECRYLSESDVKAALGEAGLEVTASDGGCAFQPSDKSGLGLRVTVTQIQIDPDDYASQAYGTCDEKLGDVSVPGATKAWLCGDIETQGNVIKGKLFVSVGVLQAFSDRPSEKQQSDLVRAVLPKIRFP